MVIIELEWGTLGVRGCPRDPPAVPCYRSSHWILRDGVVLGKGDRRLREQLWKYSNI